MALSAGTTTHAVESALPGIPRLTVVTNSRVAVVADDSKWGMVGFVVSDDGLDAGTRHALRDDCGRLVLV